MQAGPGGVTVLDHRDATTLGSAPAHAGGALHELGDTLADFFEGLISGTAQALRVVVQAAEDAWEFVCEIAGTVWRWTLDTLEQAGAFFTWLWEQVRTTLEQVWEWLKFVVDWQDILRVRNAMVDATDQAMRFMTHEVVSLRRSVDEGFTAFERQIAQWVGRTESSGGPSPGAGASAAGDAIRQVTSTAGDILHMATGNSAVAWVLQRLGGVADEIVRIEGPSPFDTVPDALGGFLTDVIADEAVVILDCITRMGRDLVEHVGGSAPGAHDLSWQALGDIAARIGGDVLQALVEAVRTIVVRALDLLVGIMQALHDALFVRVEFPFVERLAALVGWDLDTSFRFIDALMLLAAVPATITYKIAFGRAPLREGDVLELPFGSPQAQSQGHPWWWALLGLMGAFLKLAVAVHRTWEALKQVAGIAVPQTRIGQVLGTLFAVVGWVVEVLAMHSERGPAVTGIESAMVAVTGVSVLVAQSLMVWEKSRGDADLAARRAVAGVDAALTIVHLGLKAADFAILVQHPTEDEDTASESVAFTESALSHVAVVLLDGARLVDEPETQLALTAAASLCRSEAFSLGVVRVVGSHST